MLTYQPAAFSPRVPPPTSGLKGSFLGQVPIRNQIGLIPFTAIQETAPATLGRPSIGQTFDQIAGMPGWCGDVLRLTFHGGTTYIGLYVGTKEKPGFLKYFAWVMGVGNGLAAIADVISVAKRIMGTHPPEPATPPAPNPPGSAAAPAG